MSKQFNDLLNSTINEIDNKLKANVITAINIEAEKIRKQSNYAKLVAKKEKLSEELRLLDLEIDEKDWELESYRSTTPTHVRTDFKENLPVGLKNIKFVNDRSWHVSEWEAYQNLDQTNIVTNYLRFQQMKKQYIEMYRLSISEKEKRNILLQLRSLDWRQLGIDMPTIVMDYSIVSGSIQSSTKLLSNQ